MSAKDYNNQYLTVEDVAELMKVSTNKHYSVFVDRESYSWTKQKPTIDHFVKSSIIDKKRA